MKELDRYDYQRIIEQARKERSLALGNHIAALVRVVVRAIVDLVTPRPPHHRLPTA